MKRHAVYERLVVILLILCGMLLSSCSGEQPKIPVITQQTVTEYSADTVDASDMTELSEMEATEESTETVPSFVPYTLKHTVVDITSIADDAKLVVDGGGMYSPDGQYNYHTTFLMDGKLMVYGYRETNGNRECGCLLSIRDGVTEDIIAVPNIGGAIPYYAYPLSDGSFAVLWSEGPIREELYYYFGVTQSDGTLLAKMNLDEVYPDFWTNGDFKIEELENGDVILLHRGQGYFFFGILYERASQTMKLNRIVHQSDVCAYVSVEKMDYIGDWKWISFAEAERCSILDMKTGIYKNAKFRVPAGKSKMVFITDEDGNYYVYDRGGLYTYNDNLPPTKIADWNACGIKYFAGPLNLWVVDAQNFYILKTVEEKNREHHYLYYVHTEQIPDETPREIIALDYYGSMDWVTDAAVMFNRENELYEVRINYVDTANLKTDEVLAERMITQPHPDMMLVEARVSYDDYYDKNVFLDLSPYVGDLLLGCVKDATNYKGALYTVPSEMQINTFLCLPEVTEDFLTWDVFMDRAATLDDRAVLFSDKMAVKYLKENAIMDFFSLSDGTASYDSDRFREVMRFLETMEETYLDKTVGYLGTHFRGEKGYTNPTLPARLREGGLTFLNLWIRSAEDIMIARHLFGEEDFVFCGYPSEHGGGANVNMPSRMAVLADTDVKDGCIAFVKFLLDNERQTADNHMDLPVTKDGIRALFEKNRYYLYTTDVYNNIGNPAASMREPTISFDTSDPIVMISAEFSSDAPIAPETDDNGNPYGYCVELPQKDIDAFLYFLDNCHMSAGSDDTVEAIVTEELSYWQNGVKSLEEVTKIMQSRVSIYLAERQ